MNKKEHKKIIVAMSGGVDSSVTAKLIKDQGNDVLGVFMRLGIQNEKSELAARIVCKQLGIKFYPINLAEKFENQIIDYFINSYKNGITPNPCVKCNQFIKFQELLRLVGKLKYDYLATGHYVKSKKYKAKNKKNEFKLLRSKDKSKDQSYFLYNLTQEQLARILFPLGEYTKEEVKKIAKKAKLSNLKKESQDICFLYDGNKISEHNEFLKKHIKEKKGPIKTMDGKIIGEHRGLPFYTIGQRRGIEIGGTGPYYAARLDYKTNTLYVVNDHNDPALFTDKLIATKVNWIQGIEPKMTLACDVVIRYGHKPVSAIVPSPSAPLLIPPIRRASRRGERAKRGGEVYSVELKKPERAITPGQSVVFYKKDEVLGGGVIQ